MMNRPKNELRYELKYLLRREQVEPLMKELHQRLRLDTHVGPLGTYPIVSLYYDTPYYKAYWDKLDGHRSRRKLRVRVYGDTTITPETPAFLEIKQRINKMMRKRRVPLRYAEGIDFDNYATLGQARAESGDVASQAVLHEAYYLYQTLQLRPACVVAYDRMAFEGDEFAPDLRITLDFNLRGRTHDLSLLSTGIASNRTVLGSEYAVLEVKANHNIPRWVAELTARHQCTFYRISKYCLVLEKNQVISQRQHILVHGVTNKPIVPAPEPVQDAYLHPRICTVSGVPCYQIVDTCAFAEPACYQAATEHAKANEKSR